MCSGDLLIFWCNSLVLAMFILFLGALEHGSVVQLSKSMDAPPPIVDVPIDGIQIKNPQMISSIFKLWIKNVNRIYRF